jgi:hypothetical protein
MVSRAKLRSRARGIETCILFGNGHWKPGYPAPRKEIVESSGAAPAHRKKAKIYKNFISPQLGFWDWIGPYSGRIAFIEEFGMDAIYLVILAVLYGATHALVWAFERLGKTP